MALRRIRGQAIGFVDGNHYLAVLGVEDDRVRFRDPNGEGEEVMSIERLLQRSGGILLTLTRD